MQVADKMIYWEEGKCVIFDDTHKHEVWNDTNGIRVVLLFDVCRPLPGWLTLVNKFVLSLGSYLPEAYRLLRTQREWEARSSALNVSLRLGSVWSLRRRDGSSLSLAF
jgi:beta-hydroxylase